ncbi:MAG: 4-hydroxy-tetrahydrodipicolinate synthase [Gammaproteobacteria bacterium]|nr:4-hydroxy-tetrahydrodipicolinate synthase [Gammaproteobacteria bacterium]
MFGGSIVALVTPMDERGEVDYATLKALVDWHVAEGTDGIVAVGTTGESATLDFDEHESVLRHAVDYAAGRVPVIAGTGANATREAIELTERAERAGVAGCLTVTPYYNKPTQDGLFQHFKAIAESSKLPQLLYNVPGRTGVDLLPETVARLAAVSNIVGIKEATGKLERLAQIQALCGPDFLTFSGDDATALPFLAVGGHGVISVTANVAPRAMADLCRLVRSGAIAEARVVDQKLRLLHERLFVEANPIPVKWALHRQRRLPQPTLRLPLTVLSSRYHGALDEALIAAGVA